MKKTAYEIWVDGLKFRPAIRKNASQPVTFGVWLADLCQKQRMQKQAGWLDELKHPWQALKDQAKGIYYIGNDAIRGRWNDDARAEEMLKSRMGEAKYNKAVEDVKKRDAALNADISRAGMGQYGSLPDRDKINRDFDTSKQTNNIGYVPKTIPGNGNAPATANPYRPYFDETMRGMYSTKAPENRPDAYKGIGNQLSASERQRALDEYEDAVSRLGVIDHKTWDDVKGDTLAAVEFLRKHYSGLDPVAREAKIKNMMRLYGIYGSRVQRDILLNPAKRFANGFLFNLPVLDASGNEARARDYLGGIEGSLMEDAGNIAEAAGEGVRWRMFPGSKLMFGANLTASAGKRGLPPYVRGIRRLAMRDRLDQHGSGKWYDPRTFFHYLDPSIDFDRSEGANTLPEQQRKNLEEARAIQSDVKQFLLKADPGMAEQLAKAGDDVLASQKELQKALANKDLKKEDSEAYDAAVAAAQETLQAKKDRQATLDAEANRQAQEWSYDYVRHREMRMLGRRIAEHEAKSGGIDQQYRINQIDEYLTNAVDVPEAFWGSDLFRSLPAGERVGREARRLHHVTLHDYYKREGQTGITATNGLRNVIDFVKGWNGQNWPGTKKPVHNIIARAVEEASKQGEASMLKAELNRMTPYLAADIVDWATSGDPKDARVLNDKERTSAELSLRFLDSIYRYGSEDMQNAVTQGFSTVDDRKLAVWLNQLGDPNLPHGEAFGMTSVLFNNENFSDQLINGVIGPRLASQKSRRALLPAAVKLLKYNLDKGVGQGQMPTIMPKLINALRNNAEDWDKTMAEMDGKDAQQVIRTMLAIRDSGKKMSPAVLAMFGGKEGLDEFSSKFFGGIKTGIAKAALDPRKTHIAVGLWLESMGLGEVGKFFGDHPWAFWLIALSALGLGVAGISGLFGGGGQDNQTQQPQQPWYDAAASYENKYLR